ncbi:MAG TPA: lysylphosphatidylglycerol synthase transmembrane domain-containing protein [Gemmatimonadaceae bacterium]|nr:lysylphosphatidylglycerol synthase transmembrane domain-containing protein [Gemmatimonadaceae bacterium]
MKKTITRTLRLLVTVAIIAMLVVFATKVNWHSTWAAIRQSSISILIAAALVNLLSLALKGVRWWIFLRPIGANSLWLALRATFAGAGLNNVLVANSGEAARVIFVSRASHITSAKVLATLALERLFELIGYVVMLALAVSLLPLPSALERTRPFAWLALLLIAVMLVYLVRRPEGIEQAATATEVGWRAKTRRYMRRFMHAIAGISTGPRFSAALALSVAIWALQVATYALTAAAAHFPLPLVGTVAAILAVNIGFAIRATPGNVGVFQMMYAATTTAFGYDENTALAVAFLIQTQQILPVTILGIALAPEFIFQKRRRAARPDNILPDEPVLPKGAEAPS